jgi:histidyl-tRNA synthetase
MGPMFRHERPQKGRLRQFFQFGGELIMDPSAEADAELIALLHQIYQTFGISEYEIRINSVGCSNCRPVYKEALKDFLRPKFNELCELCQKRFERSPLRILDCKRESCQALIKGAPLILDHLDEACRNHHAMLKARLDSAQIPFIEDPNIVRGLDYYSRTAFEFTSNLLGAQSALGGGGRYDGLSERFGEAAFPAVGFALGMERLMMVLEEKKVLPDTRRVPRYHFIALGEAAFELLYPLSLRLKRRGVWAEMGYAPDKSLKSQLKQANRNGASFTLILGETELQNQQALLKNMATGTQETISLNELEEELMRRISLAV